MISSLDPRKATTGNFDAVRQHLLSNGRLFVSRAKAGRERIASYGRHFVRDGSVVLTHGGSRVVGALLSKAAEASASGGNVRFNVIYVMNDARNSESKAVVASLRAKGVPVATIPEGAVGYALGKVDLVMVGAEGVVEEWEASFPDSGHIRLDCLQRPPTSLSSSLRKATSSYDYIRLDQFDLGFDQEVIKFTTKNEGEVDTLRDKNLEAVERLEYFEKPELPGPAVDSVDYTVSASYGLSYKICTNMDHSHPVW